MKKLLFVATLLVSACGTTNNTSSVASRHTAPAADHEGFQVVLTAGGFAFHGEVVVSQDGRILDTIFCTREQNVDAASWSCKNDTIAVEINSSAVPNLTKADLSFISTGKPAIRLDCKAAPKSTIHAADGMNDVLICK